MPVVHVRSIEIGKAWVAKHPRAATAVAAMVSALGLVALPFAWSWYRSYPAAPPHLSIAQARPQVGGAHDPWILTDPLVIDCASEMVRGERSYAAASVPGLPDALVVVDHPSHVACARLDRRPIVGVLTRPAARTRRSWARQGFAPGTASASVDLLELRTDDGPPEAEAALAFAIGLFVAGALAAVTIRHRLGATRTA
jgi:hypothetical protein